MRAIMTFFFFPSHPLCVFPLLSLMTLQPGGARNTHSHTHKGDTNIYRGKAKDNSTGEQQHNNNNNNKF
uniref:Secreted protein n=1 Tax=Physcomitrium patens TaxID=3218 RepID=A0A2K1JDU4_PHYPA|nr:hypothetical protein PHYPA_019958 [Physcomitrium patens]